jgi:stage II sporulation protein M
VNNAGEEFSKLMEEHFISNFFIYFLVFASVVLGVIFGTIVMSKLEPSQAHELMTYLEDFFKGYDLGSLPSKDVVAKERILGNLKVLGMAWLLGISVIGAPLLIVLLFIRGFIVGFTVGFLIKEFFFKGALMALLSVLPHNLLFLPALCLISVGALSFSTSLLRRRGGRYYRKEFSRGLIGFTLLAVIMLMLGGVAGLIEAYITPVFMKAISRFLI